MVMVSMSRPRRVLVGVVSGLLLAALSACGGGGSTGDTAVKVGGSAISAAAVAHWTTALLGDYYNEKVGAIAPGGLISAPPAYASCVADLKASAPADADNGRAAPEAATLRSKCEQLNRAMKREAVTYLIDSQWLLGEDAEAGVTISSAEFARYFAQVKAERFPTEAALQTYLAGKGWTLADELYSTRQELRSGKLLQALLKSHHKGGLNVKKWTAMTDCMPGYVVEQCKQYNASDAPTGPSAAVLVEEVGALATVHHPNPDANEDQLCKNAPTASGYSCVAVPLGRGAATHAGKPTSKP